VLIRNQHARNTHLSSIGSANTSGIQTGPHQIAAGNRDTQQGVQRSFMLHKPRSIVSLALVLDEVWRIRISDHFHVRCLLALVLAAAVLTPIRPSELFIARIRVWPLRQRYKPCEHID
jgi:hypothetical protein